VVVVSIVYHLQLVHISSTSPTWLWPIITIVTLEKNKTVMIVIGNGL
jgi:hypothetical protein